MIREYINDDLPEDEKEKDRVHVCTMMKLLSK